MNFGNSKTSGPHRLLLNLSDKINLKRSDKYIALSNISTYYTWKKINKSYKNNKFKISTPAKNEDFDYLMGHILYHDIQDYFELLYLKKTLRKD